MIIRAKCCRITTPNSTMSLTWYKPNSGFFEELVDIFVFSKNPSLPGLHFLVSTRHKSIFLFSNENRLYSVDSAGKSSELIIESSVLELYDILEIQRVVLSAITWHECWKQCILENAEMLPFCGDELVVHNFADLLLLVRE